MKMFLEADTKEKRMAIIAVGDALYVDTDNETITWWKGLKQAALSLNSSSK